MPELAAFIAQEDNLTPMSPSNLRHITVALAAVAVIVTGFSLLGRQFWLAEILSHFRPQMAFGSVLLVVLALATRQRLGIALAAAAAIANALPLLPYLEAPGAAAAANDATPVKILAFNLRGSHADRPGLQRLVAQERPDIVVLTELPREQQHRLDLFNGAFLSFPLVIFDDVGSSHDVVIYSSWRALETRVDRSVSRRLPVVSADLCAPHHADAAPRCLRLVALHAARPLDGGAPARDAQLDLAGRLAAAAPSGSAIVAGDLNLTPWSPVFAELLARAGLRDSGTGRGLVATWLSRFVLFGLPIDHVLIGDAFDVRERRIAADLGSDHLPVIVELGLRR